MPGHTNWAIVRAEAARRDPTFQTRVAEYRRQYRFAACDVCWHETILEPAGRGRWMCGPCLGEWAR
jgi:hypothetical protein